ncbi:hypothetical protein ACFE04_004559 [Oxalis oulophora]
MALQLWDTLKEAIAVYTGLTPTSFFTILALAWAVYYVISSLFVSPDHGHVTPRTMEQMPPIQPPVQLGEITEEELRLYDGSDPNKPLLMAIKSQIYDVSRSRMFYGPGGPYALFAGKDASRALAKMSFEEKDLTGDISGLGPFELDALQDWEYKFESKYVKVGTIKTPGGSTSDEPIKAENEDTVNPAEDGPSEIPSETTATETVGPSVDDTEK